MKPAPPSIPKAPETTNKNPVQPEPKPWVPANSRPGKESGQEASLPDHDPLEEQDSHEEEHSTKTTAPDGEEPKPQLPLEEEKVSTFDVDGFFARARVLMKDRAAPIISENTEKLTKNLDDFERGAKRFIRRMDRGNNRDDAEEALEDLMQSAITERHHLPKKLPGDLNGVNELDDLHEECLEIQDELDLTLMANLRQLSNLYVVGLEKQIERLDAKIDEKPIDLIRDEIEKTKESETHFPHLMLGIEEPTDAKGAPLPSKKPLPE